MITVLAGGTGSIKLIRGLASRHTDIFVAAAENTETAANHRFGAGQPGQAHARRDVIVVAVHERPAEAAAPRILHGDQLREAGTGIGNEVRLPVELFHPRCGNFVADTQVQGEGSGRFSSRLACRN